MTVYLYRWNRQGRKGQRCIVTVRGTMNSCRVKFLDGYEMVTSRNAIMKDKTMTQEGWQNATGEKINQQGFADRLAALIELGKKSGLRDHNMVGELRDQADILNAGPSST